jgi:HK97 family phage prohead protease
MTTDTRFEIRQLGNGDLNLQGYAATFEHPYDIGGWYQETIAKDAFKRSLMQAPNGPDVVLTVNHGHVGSGLPIARTTAGTLRLAQDGHGLLVDADLDPQDPEVQSLHRKMLRGDLDGQMSFSFRAVEQTWNQDRTARRIIQADINKGDVSVVNHGANDTTSSHIRSASAGGVPLEVRRRRAETMGQRFTGAGYSFAGAGVVGVGLGAPPDLTPKRAQQRLDVLRLDTGDRVSMSRSRRHGMAGAKAAAELNRKRLELMRRAQR